MEVIALAKYVRVSPRKLQLLARGIKQMRPDAATVALGFMRQSGAKPLQSVIASAIANAKNRNLAAVDELIIKEIQVLPGTAMKRFRAVSRGMAHSYKKRMSHIKVILTDAKQTQTKGKVDLQKSEIRSTKSETNSKV